MRCLRFICGAAIYGRVRNERILEKSEEKLGLRAREKQNKS